MTWTGPRELRAQVQRWWDRGELLAEQVRSESAFPRRLTLKKPGSAEITEQFDAVRNWIAELRGLPHYRVESREIRHRVFGMNQIPKSVWVDTVDDALAILGKSRDFRRFGALVSMTRTRRPALLHWLERKPHKALDLHDDWERLLDVVDWLEAHPRPHIYLRQIDIPGVDSKFIEAHRGILLQWLDRVLPAAAIDESAAGVAGFVRRYGFREKPLRVRLRLLDPAHALLPELDQADMTLDAASLGRLGLTVERAFITENEVNFLAFPAISDSVLIFGAGYGFEVLSGISWLAGCRVHYWGDIDTHGFAILDQLRVHVPHAHSMLMDWNTLRAFEAHWGEEVNQTQRNLPRLTSEEHALYDDLRENRIRDRLRLEQERIGYEWVKGFLAELD